MCIIIIKCSKGECKDSKEYEFVAIEITLGMCRGYLIIYNETVDSVLQLSFYSSDFLLKNQVERGTTTIRSFVEIARRLQTQSKDTRTMKSVN